MTISLPPDMLAELDRLRKKEHRTRSEQIEALRCYTRAVRLAMNVPAKIQPITRNCSAA
jgi:metal-responsive CopG/Arc/MetJ family transcriptional regulator